jgi:hypothetical protein
MQKRVIDNRFILMDDNEWQCYQDICKSYDKPPHIRGADLFVGMVETDNDGIITFIRPPSVRQTSMECYLFICSVYQSQQARLMRSQVDQLCAKIKADADKIFADLRTEMINTLSNLTVGNKSRRS